MSRSPTGKNQSVAGDTPGTPSLLLLPTIIFSQIYLWVLLSLMQNRLSLLPPELSSIERALVLA